MLVDLGRASTSSRRLFIHAKNGAEILRRLILIELLFKIIVIEIGNGCIEIFNAAIVLEDIISHLFALAGVEYLLLMEVVLTELLNALAVSLGASGEHSLVAHLIVAHYNVNKHELVAESLLEYLDIRRRTDARNKEIGAVGLLDLLDDKLGEEGLAVCGHILLRSGVEIVSRQLKAAAASSLTTSPMEIIGKP